MPPTRASGNTAKNFSTLLICPSVLAGSGVYPPHSAGHRHHLGSILHGVCHITDLGRLVLEFVHLTQLGIVTVSVGIQDCAVTGYVTEVTVPYVPFLVIR